MDGFKGFWGGVLLTVIVVAALTRFNVPVASDVVSKLANRQ